MPNLNKPLQSVTQNDEEYPLLNPNLGKPEKNQERQTDQIPKTSDSGPTKPFERNMSKPNFSANSQPLNQTNPSPIKNPDPLKQTETPKPQTENKKPSDSNENSNSKPLELPDSLSNNAGA